MTGADTIAADQQRWWRRHDLDYVDGHLQFAGHDVTTLASQYDSPTFVYSFDRVTDNIRRLRDALNDAEISLDRLWYAMKANRFAPLLTALKYSGLVGIDACSPAEVAHAISCGFAPNEISLTATSMAEYDFAAVARFDGLVVNCDSIAAIRRWGALRPGSTIGIRINPGAGVSRADNATLQYAGNQTSKFGIYREQFAEALQVAADVGLTVRRIHCHTGCGFLTPQLTEWEKVLKQCLWFVDHAPDVCEVNLGGGLGVPHLPADEPLDLKRWASIIYHHFSRRDVTVQIEPGEYLVKDAGLLLLRTTFVERKRDTLFVGVNAGCNIAPEPAFYQLPFAPIPLVEEAPVAKATVVGHINEALDVWYRDVPLPDMREQRFLALINAGAYSAAMASNHCMRGDYREQLLL